MAKKKSNQQAVRPLKPEEYIRKRARQLPIYKCYKGINHFEDREMAIVVVRQHTQGNFTLGAYMIDRWCLGVKDSLWQFNIDEDELEELLSHLSHNMDDFEEVEYVEAHNWVYGAVGFAEDAGIKPCKDFALTQYILEEDDDNVELIEYEFGRDGEYCLVAKDRQEAARYVPTLDCNLGKGNYTVEVGIFGDDFDDDEEDEPFGGFPPDMEYTYKGKDYPKEVVLHHPELDEILLKDMEDVTDEDIEEVLLLPDDEAREDLQNILLREIGRQWGKTRDELGEIEIESWNIVANALMFLTHFGTVEETLPVVLEVMRQSRAFSDYNFADSSDDLLDPVLCMLVKDNPRLLKSYLLEPGLYNYFKIEAFELLKNIAQFCPDVRDEIVDMTVEVLQEYKRDLTKRTICDGSVTAFAISVLYGTGAKEHLPLIEELYATGLLYEGLLGHIEMVRTEIQHTHPGFKLPPMDPFSVRDKYRRIFGGDK